MEETSEVSIALADEWILANFRDEMDRLRISINPSEHLLALLRLALRQRDFIYNFEPHLLSLDMNITLKSALLIALAESCRSVRQRADVLDMKRSIILREIESLKIQRIWIRLSDREKVDVLRSLETHPDWALGSAKDFSCHIKNSLSRLIHLSDDSDIN